MPETVQKYARVKVENETTQVILPITTNKPEIPEQMQQKWQKIVDLTAKIMNVPSGLITRLTTENLEILIASQTKGNPYKKHDHDKLGIGMFCETVAGKRHGMLVNDTWESEYWKNNPHAPLGMRSYLGMPIQWEDGEMFGTFCVLTDKTNQFTNDYVELIQQFKDIIETDLKYLLFYEQLLKKLSEKELQIREVHHRIKNQFNLLISMIYLQSKEINNETNIQNILMEIQNRIRTISLIHEKLYQTGGTTAPVLDVYIKQLCGFIIQDFMQQNIDMVYNIEPLSLPPDISLPCALIISELMTNSIKHAFKGISNPQISLHISRSGDAVTINYRDNGVGLPEDFDLDHSESMGMRLIKGLSMQLHGTLEFIKKHGVECKIVFPVKAIIT